MYGVRINLVLHLCCWNCSTLGSLSIIYHAYGAREKYLFILQLVFPFIGFICAIFVMNILNRYGLLLYFIHPCFVFEEIQQTIDNRHSFHSLGWDSKFSVSFVSRLRRVSTLTYWFYSKLSRESQMLSEYCCCHCQWICWYVYAKKCRRTMENLIKFNVPVASCLSNIFIAAHHFRASWNAQQYQTPLMQICIFIRTIKWNEDKSKAYSK